MEATRERSQDGVLADANQANGQLDHSGTPTVHVLDTWLLIAISVINNSVLFY